MDMVIWALGDSNACQLSIVDDMVIHGMGIYLAFKFPTLDTTRLQKWNCDVYDSIRKIAPLLKAGSDFNQYIVLLAKHCLYHWAGGTNPHTHIHTIYIHIHTVHEMYTKHVCANVSICCVYICKYFFCT
jgi:hypothetical protein